MIKNEKKILAYLFSIFCLGAIWIIASKIISSELILPGPESVFFALVNLVKTKSFWNAFFYTFLRVIISFLITVIAGSFIGFLCGFSDFAKAFFEFPISVVRVTPVVAFILIALFWFKSGTVPVFVSVLMTLPIMCTAVMNGFEKTDKQLLAMAKVYNFSTKQIFKYIQLPAIIPFFLNGTVSTFGLTWKVVVAGEVLCLPKNAAGSMLQRSQIHLETSSVLAITIILILFSFLLEKLFSLLIQKKLRKDK